MVTITIIGYVRPGFLPAGPRSSWSERLGGAARHLGDAAAVRLRHRRPLRRPVHADRGGAAWAPAAPSSSASLRGRLSGADILRSLLEATRTTAAVFTVLIGAILFGYFLTVTQTPQKVTEFLTGLGLGRYGVLALIMLMYLVLGCLMDALAMIILTVPIIFPVIKQLRLRPDLVRRHHRHDGGAGADPSARRHEHLRHQERGRGREDSRPSSMACCRSSSPTSCG